MNDNGPAWTENELRTALAPDDTIVPLDPARVIAGARRRRTVRGLAVAAVTVVAVAGVATGGVLAGGYSLGGNAPGPANPGPTTLIAPSSAPTTPRATPPHTPRPPSSTAGGTAGTPETQVSVTPASCVAALNGEPGPGSSATLRSRVRDSIGETILIADSRSWAVCDNTWVGQVAARRPERMQRPTAQNTDAFAVAGQTLVLPAGERDFYWAGGMVPQGVVAIRYTFPDGTTVNATVVGEFWLMRHLSGTAGSPPKTKIRVQLLSGSGAIVNDFRLAWGEQTCAQISHGC